MISAAKFFQETKEAEAKAEQEEVANNRRLVENRFCQWKKESNTIWRVVHDSSPSQSEQQLNVSGNTAAKDNDEWIGTLQSYLQQSGSSTRAKTTATAASKELLQNRHGCSISSPLRLCSRTLTKTILTPTKAGGPSSSFCIAGLSLGGSDSKPMEFFYYRGNNNHNKFPSSPEGEGKDSIPLGYEEVEEISMQNNKRIQEEKKQEDSNNNKRSGGGKVLFIMEIQHRACKTSSSTSTSLTLTEIGLIWDNNGKDDEGSNTSSPKQQYVSGPSYLSAASNSIWSNQASSSQQQSPLQSSSTNNTTTNNADGIRVKLISSQTLRKIVGGINGPRKQQQQQQQQQQGGNGNDGGKEDLTWILTELERATPLALPQSVGSGSSSDGGGVSPSLLLLVTLDPTSMTNASSSSFHSSVAETFTQNGHLVLKFHRTERTTPYHPISNQCSIANFVIGRSLQIVHHPSSEQEDIQKALSAALCNAEKFIPEWKRNQWDNVADALIMVLPHPTLPDNIATWLRRPEIRRSHFDFALSNVLLHLPHPLLWHPPRVHYVDRVSSIPQVVWNDIRFAHENISAMINNVKANAIYHQTERIGDASIIDGKVLYNLCNELESGTKLHQHMMHPSREHILEHCASIQLGYLSRMLTALRIERLKCHHDMKKHDMYSICWKDNIIYIPPPLSPRSTCPRCSRGAAPRISSTGSPYCPYHLAQTHVEEDTGKTPPPGKPIAIRTKRQLEKLPLVLWSMLPSDSLMANIQVPGVAEDFPLVSIGDFVRLFFRSPGPQGISTEVVAEVVDVTVKTETVTIRLPSPLQGQFWTITPGVIPHQPGLPGRHTIHCLPYLQSLVYTNNYYLDAQKILHSSMIQEAHPFQDDNHRKEMIDKFRLDVRFGFQGGRGFDIIEEVLGELFKPATRRPTMPQTNNKQQRKSPHHYNRDMINLKIAKHMHLHRILAPTRKLLEANIQAGGKRYISFTKDRKEMSTLQFVTPVNQEQKRAVEDIVYKFHGRACYIIEGPAGTGKSMCVCEAIIQVLRTAPTSKILVCAPSDAACDVLAARLKPLLQTQKLLRINWWSRKVASVKPELLSSCPMDPNGGSFAVPSLRALKQAGVIVCQCFVAECLELAGTRGWIQDHFTHLFVDECSQAMECECLVPLAKVGTNCSIVLAGDPKQLGPTVRDPTAARMGLGVSIQERLLSLPLYKGHFCVHTRLVNNYRSNEALLTVPSSLFYDGSLKAKAEKKVAEPFADLGDLGHAGFPLLLCNVHDGLERSKLDTPSFYNIEECNAVVSLVRGLLLCRTKEGVPPLHTGQICVITPFRAQVLALRTILRASGLGGINVGVVEDFQGQESQVVLISTVLTREHQRWSSSSNGDSKADDPGQRLGFLHDPKRFNVAITRAHALCVIVGHAEYLERSGTYWAALMDHIKRNDGVLGEEMEEEEEEVAEEDEDRYGIADLLRRVDELRLLGAGAEQDRHDMSYYYSDVPQWKVMLS